LSWESLYLCSFFRPKFQPAGRPVTTTLLTSRLITMVPITNTMILVLLPGTISVAAIRLYIIRVVLLGVQLVAVLLLVSAPPVPAVTGAIIDLRAILAADLIMNMTVLGEQAVAPMEDIATDIDIVPGPAPVAAVLTAAGPAGILTTLVQAASIVPAARVIPNVLPVLAATDVVTDPQAIPATPTMNIITVVLGDTLLEMMQDISIVQDLDIAPDPAPVAAVLTAAGPAGLAGPFTLLAALPNTAQAAVV